MTYMVEYTRPDDPKPQLVLCSGDRDSADCLAKFLAFHRDRRNTVNQATIRQCDYCGERPANGYVSAYAACVCEECYDDHHGTIDA